MFKVVLSFMFSQGLTQAMTLGVGFAILHLLPIEQYALYSIASAILIVVNLGSDFGLSQGIISIGSSRRDDYGYVGCLYNAARWWTRRFMVVATLLSIGLSSLLFMNSPWPLSIKIAAVTIVIFVGWAQVGSTLGRAVLNIHHDARSLFHVSLGETGIRMVLLPLFIIWPTAIAALLANLVGAFVANWIALHRSWKKCDRYAEGGPEERRALIRFAAPLAPIIVYTVLQGQIAILLLSAYADIRAIAETAALARLGQVFTVLMLINAFLVQPILARVKMRSDYLAKLAWLVFALVALYTVVMTSALLRPEWWLLIVGDKYAGLTKEVPIALATSLVTLAGASLYVAVIARGSTKSQSIAILPCLCSQMVFVATHGVRTTWDALILILIPAVAYALVQVGLLLIIVMRWPQEQR